MARSFKEVYLSEEGVCREKAASNNQHYCYGFTHAPDVGLDAPNFVGCSKFDYWLSFGTLGASGIYRQGCFINTTGDFRFDKARLKREIKKEYRYFAGCRLLDFDVVLRFIDAMPWQVNPKYQAGWAVYPQCVKENKALEEIRSMGFKIADVPLTPFGEEYPVVVDGTALYEIINQTYPNGANDTQRKGLDAAFNQLYKDIRTFIYSE